MKSDNRILTIQYLTVIIITISPVLSMAQEYQLTDERHLSFLSRFTQTYENALLNDQPELLDSYWSDDIRLMPEYQKTVMGRANAMIYQKAFINRFDVLNYKRKTLETLDLGSMIVEFGTFNMSVKLKKNGQQYTILGNYGNFWKVGNTGSLLLITETWNYREQVECVSYLVFDKVPVVDIATEAHIPVNDNISFEIKAMNSFTEEFITQNDDVLWSQLYGDDCKLIYSNNPIYSGKNEIREFLKKHVQEMPIFEKLDIRTDRINKLGDFIIEYSSHIAITKNGDWSGVNTGKNIVIWKREPDCSLKIFRSMAMYD